MTKKRAIGLMVPVLLLFVGGASSRPKQKQVQTANIWLRQAAKQTDKLDVYSSDWGKRIGLDDSHGVLISDKKVIRRLIGLLKCSGSLSNPRDAVKDVPDMAAGDSSGVGDSLEIVLSPKGAGEYSPKTQYLYVFKFGHRYRLQRHHYTVDPSSVSPPDVTLGSAALDPQSLTRFLKAVRAVVATAHRKGSKVNVYKAQLPDTAS